MVRYIPERGDFVTLSFDPQTGTEQRGRRPALVISKQLFNQRTGLVIVCPITNTQRNIPFHVAVPQGLPLTGYIMVEQVKSLDFNARHVKFVAHAPIATLTELLAILDAIVYQ
jgi:mRNA interferase MazF